MSSRAYGQRLYRRALAAGLIVSVGVHAAVLGMGRIEIPGFTGRSDARPAAEPIALAELPIQVIQIRRPVESATPTERLAGLPAPGLLSASLASTILSATKLLQLVEVPERPSADPVAAYATVEDLLIDAKPNPSRLRAIDDRPVVVLAAIGTGRAGGFGVIGGNGCAAPGGSLIGPPARFVPRY
ncbi:MAG: hypothetical protein ACE5HF_01835 [Gemmatimonadota bacterium]